MWKIFKSLRLLLVFACAYGFQAQSSRAQPVESFYQVHPLTILIGYTTGAVYDAYARTIARHISKHLPGNPSVIPQNMPGAGSLKVVNYLYNTASKDGAYIATFSRGIPMQPLLDKQGIYFDALKLNWIGSPSTEVSVVFSWHTTPLKTIQDVLVRDMVVAATGSGADSAIFPYVLNSVLKTNFKVITGYPGAAETMLAVERGEVDGNAGTSWSNMMAIKPDWVKNNQINVMLQLSTQPSPDLRGVPFVMDLAKSDEDKRVLDFIFSRQSMAYPYAAPPDVPTNRLDALRKAFDATMRDPNFLADAKRQNLEINPVTGASITEVISRVYASSPDVIARVRTAIEDGQKQSREKQQ